MKSNNDDVSDIKPSDFELARYLLLDHETAKKRLFGYAMPRAYSLRAYSRAQGVDSREFVPGVIPMGVDGDISKCRPFAFESIIFGGLYHRMEGDLYLATQALSNSSPDDSMRGQIFVLVQEIGHHLTWIRQEMQARSSGGVRGILKRYCRRVDSRLAFQITELGRPALATIKKKYIEEYGPARRIAINIDKEEPVPTISIDMLGPSAVGNLMHVAALILSREDHFYVQTAKRALRLPVISLAERGILDVEDVETALVEALSDVRLVKALFSGKKPGPASALVALYTILTGDSGKWLLSGYREHRKRSKADK